MSAQPVNILVRAPNWVGDAVMATPALRALRRAHPEARIVLEGRPLLRELLEGLPGIDAFLPDAGRGLAALARRVQVLRAARFDWAVLLPDSARAAAAPFLARIPVRAGYARDLARRTMLTLALEAPREGGQRKAISMVARYQAITRALHCPDAGDRLDLVVRDSARQAIETRLGALGVGRREPLLVVTPGASFGSSKLWPPAHFARACDGLAEQHGLLPVLAPGPGEEPIAAAVLDAMQTKGHALVDPPTTLAELSALIERGQLLLTNDTGPRQLAVALERPVVVVMGPTDPGHTNHLLERQRVLVEDVECRPCHLKTCPIDHRCMTRLEPARVVSAAGELLA